MRTCPECKEKYSPKYSSLQPTCNEFKCMAEHATNTRLKKEKSQKQEDKEFKRKFQLKDLDYQHKLTRAVFNRMRVIEEKLWFTDRGIEPYCISCQRENMDWSCGHLKTVGAQGNIRYDRMNTYLQCNWACNKNLSGNINGNKTSTGYLAGLLLRFGEEEGQRIIDYCDSHTKPAKWDGQWLINFRKECNARIRELS